MQFRIFTKPILDGKTQEEEMNLFLRGHKIVSVDKHYSESAALWCFCVTYIESNRVLRGGSWNNNASNCRAANRNNNSPGNRNNNNNGFRLALAQKTVSDDPSVNRESSCVSAKDTENEQCLIAKHPILVGMPDVLSKNLDVFISSIITKSSSIK